MSGEFFYLLMRGSKNERAQELKVRERAHYQHLYSCYDSKKTFFFHYLIFVTNLFILG